jgi:hypothetical protein
MTTFVTAFYDLSKIDKESQCRKGYPEYKEHLEAMLKILQGHNFIYFNEEELPLSSLEYYDQWEKLISLRSANYPSGLNPDKDTSLYAIIGWNKFNFLRLAARKNPYKSTKFVWIDIGITHIVPSGDLIYLKEIEDLDEDKIRLCMLSPIDKPCHNFYASIQSYAVGGIISCPIHLVEDLVSWVYEEIDRMLSSGWVNNEDAVLSAVSSLHRESFVFSYGAYYECLCNFSGKKRGPNRLMQSQLDYLTKHEMWDEGLNWCKFQKTGGREGKVIEFEKLCLGKINERGVRKKLAIGIYGSANSQKYIDQLNACHSTWAGQAHYFVGEKRCKEFDKFPSSRISYLEKWGDEMESAHGKYYQGLHWLFDNIDADFYLMIGSDSYVHLNELYSFLGKLNPDELSYIGGHGFRKKNLYYHSGGSGPIFSKALMKAIFTSGLESDWIEKLRDDFGNFIENHSESYACDWSIVYLMQKLNIKYTTVTNSGFCGCRHPLSQSRPYCCQRGFHGVPLLITHYLDPLEMFKIREMEIPGVPDLSWTIVTAFFDLGCNPRSKYLPEEGSVPPVILLPFNMVLFTSPDLAEQFKRWREEAGLISKTKIIAMNFEDFPLYRYREKIRKNREGNKLYEGHRITPDAFVLYVSKFWMVEKVRTLDCFRSDFLMWLDFGSPSTIKDGFVSSDIKLLEIMKQYRRKFSCLLLNWVDSRIVFDNKEYYRRGGEYVCAGGLMTADIQHWEWMHKKIEQLFVETVEAGYGHADEQIIFRAFLENPEKFEIYFGDYPEIFDNYILFKKGMNSGYRILSSFVDKKEDVACRVQFANTILDSYLGLVDIPPRLLFSALEQAMFAQWWFGDKIDYAKTVEKIYFLIRDSDIMLDYFISVPRLLKNTDFYESVHKWKRQILTTGGKLSHRSMLCHRGIIER